MALIKYANPEIFGEEVFMGVAENISYWKEDIAQHSCHLFVVKIGSEEQLLDLWEKITARIALGFQSNLEQEIEIYNIYLVFFVNNKISKELKYKIEQNKYCCRKLVEDEFGEMEFSETFISEQIGAQIFSMNSISSANDIALVDETVESIIQKRDAKILTVLKDYQASNHKFEPYYNKFIELTNGKH